jgi:hypothetical protein
MLAQNFKTAADLGISEVELDALIKVLGMLERGELKHTESYGDLAYEAPLGAIVGFNMSSYYGEGTCGTVCCIAGWAEVVGRLPRNSMAETANQGLSALFLPGIGKCLEDIRPDKAAIALRSYLTTGDANWAEAFTA